MSGRSFTRNSAPRSGTWSNSKYTNCNTYDPWRLERWEWHDKLYDKIEAHEGILYHQVKTHPDFIAPVRLNEVKKVVNSMPQEFIKDLKAIVLLGGTAKQAKSAWNGLTYGVYSNGKIYLHAFPKRKLSWFYKKYPKPSILQEYERAGAIFTQKKGWLRVDFTKDTLRQFYHP